MIAGLEVPRPHVQDCPECGLSNYRGRYDARACVCPVPEFEWTLRVQGRSALLWGGAWPRVQFDAYKRRHYVGFLQDTLELFHRTAEHVSCFQRLELPQILETRCPHCHKSSTQTPICNCDLASEWSVTVDVVVPPHMLQVVRETPDEIELRCATPRRLDLYHVGDSCLFHVAMGLHNVRGSDQAVLERQSRI